MEAAIGFEPMNNGFADRCLSHLAMPPLKKEQWNVGILEGWGKTKTEDLHIIPVFHYSSIPESSMERETGLEPATTTLATWGSTN